MPGLPSSELLVATFQAELDRRRAHFDSLDTKAGLVLAFSGLLISLPRSVPFGFLVAGAILTAAAAAAALASLWPRRFPVLAPARLADYLAAEPEFTRSKLVDTLEVMLGEASTLLERKGDALRWAFGLLSAGLIVTAVGAIAQGAGS